jgi:hypothetical protein
MSLRYQGLTSPQANRLNIMPKKWFNLPATALRLLAVTFIALIFVERPLRAYADPGSGLLAWQLLGAVVLGAVYNFRRVLRRLKGFVRTKPQASPETAADSSTRQGQGGTRSGLFLS